MQLARGGPNIFAKSGNNIAYLATLHGLPSATISLGFRATYKSNNSLCSYVGYV